MVMDTEASSRHAGGAEIHGGRTGETLWIYADILAY